MGQENIKGIERYNGTNLLVKWLANWLICSYHKF